MLVAMSWSLAENHNLKKNHVDLDKLQYPNEGKYMLFYLQKVAPSVNL